MRRGGWGGGGGREERRALNIVEEIHQLDKKTIFSCEEGNVDPRLQRTRREELDLTLNRNDTKYQISSGHTTFCVHVHVHGRVTLKCVCVFYSTIRMSSAVAQTSSGPVLAHCSAHKKCGGNGKS